MTKLEKCIYKGGLACRRQGGDGSLQHSSEYTHPFPTVKELGEPLEEPPQPINKASRVVNVPDLNLMFDEDLAKSVLQLPFAEALEAEDVIKSLYDFDLTSDEGVNKLMELLPIMDPDILSDVMEEIWPGYVVDDLPPDLMRAEIKGYLMDYLREYGEEAKAT